MDQVTVPVRKYQASTMNDQYCANLDFSEELKQIVSSGHAKHLAAFMHLLPPEDTPYTISHLDVAGRTHMFSMLASVNADLAADLMKHFVDEQAADMIDQLDPGEAAAIVDEMDSDEQTDVLAELDIADAEAILDRMDPAEAADARNRLRYEDQSAGGLMITELLAYQLDQDVDNVIHDLRAHVEEYGDCEVRYLYVIDGSRQLNGVVTMRSLVMAQPGQMLTHLMVISPRTVSDQTSLEDLEDLFDRVDYSAVPVVDGAGRLLGVVQRAAVQEALSESASENLLKVSGIVAGEEFRGMPLQSRVVRRLTFLMPIMLLLLASATIIALFQTTVEKLPILAAFLPVVAGLCGSGGNQAVGVSLREISLGLIKPSDWPQVVGKELAVALLTGLILGASLIGIVWLWQGNLPLALVVGGAVPIVILVAKCVGGGAPLLLRSLKVDPAMASGPMVTTIVDLFSFFVVLLLATWMLAWMG